MKLALAITLALAMTSGAAQAKSCKDPTTGKFVTCPAGAAASTAGKAANGAVSTAGKAASGVGSTMGAAASGAGHMASGATSAATGAVNTAATTATGKHCVKGKPCGNACIAMSDTCHK